MGRKGSSGEWGDARDARDARDSREGNRSGRGAAPQGPSDSGSRRGTRVRMSNSQVTTALREAQQLQQEGRLTQAVQICEELQESGVDRSDVRYFLGWLYQEADRWEDAAGQFEALLGEADYALSCFYALGQCARAMGNIQDAAHYFDEAVDRVNLDALAVEESYQLIQLCQEAAEAHRDMSDAEGAETIYSALLGFLRSQNWPEQISEVERLMRETLGVNPPQPKRRRGATASRTLGENIPQRDGPGRGRGITGAQAPNGSGVGAAGPSASQTGLASPNGSTPGMGGAINPAGSVAGAPLMPPMAPIPPIPPTPTGFDQFGAEAQQPMAPPTQPGYGQGGYDPYGQGMAPGMGGTLGGGPQHMVGGGMATLVGGAPGMGALGMGGMGAPGAGSGYPPTGGGADRLAQLINNLSGPAIGMRAGVSNLPEAQGVQVALAVRDFEIYVAHGLLTAAVEECLRVMEIAPQYLDIHLLLGEIYVRQGKIEQAIAKYAILVDTYLVNGRMDDAIATYRRILQLEPNNLNYRVKLIDVLVKQGRTEEALTERMAAADSYLRMGYADRAIQEYEQALLAHPNSTPVRLNYAAALMKGGRAAQAVGEYQRILQADSSNTLALTRWQIALATGVGAAPGISNPGMAGGAASRVAAMETLGRLVRALRAENFRNYDEIVREYTQALDMNSGNFELRYALGQIHLAANRQQEALTCFQQVTTAPGMEVLARFAAGQAYLLTGDPANAALAARELEEASPPRRSPPPAPTQRSAPPPGER